jgi:serine/threonine protein kinase
VTGKVPFEGDMSEVYGSILNKEPILPSEINAQSKDLEPIIMKCLNKVKDERYSSMEELLKDLEDYRQPSDDTVIMPEE